MNSIFDCFEHDINILVKKVKYKDVYLPDVLINNIIKILFKNIKDDIEILKYVALIKMLSKQKYNFIVTNIIPKLTQKQKYYLTYQINPQKKLKFNKWINTNSDIKEYYIKNKIIFNMDKVKWTKKIDKMVFINCIFYQDTNLLNCNIIFNKKNIKREKNIICIGCVFCGPVIIEGKCNIAFTGCIFTDKIPLGNNITNYCNNVYKNTTILIANTIQYGFFNNQDNIVNIMNNIFSRIDLDNESNNIINNFNTNYTTCLVCKRKEKCCKKKCVYCKSILFIDKNILDINLKEKMNKVENSDSIISLL